MLHIETRANRPPAAERVIKALVLGPSGIGKTTLLKSLDPETTLFVDAEAGDLAVKDWIEAGGARIDVFGQAQALGLPVWDVARGLAAWMGGPVPGAKPDQTYSQAHYDHVRGILGDPAVLSPYRTIFFDSITVLSRACFTWAATQPRAWSDKKNAPDMLGQYGLTSDEMIGWLTHLQHVQHKNVVMVGILDQKKDDYGKTTWEPQLAGAGTGRALPGIFDEVISMVVYRDSSGQPVLDEQGNQVRCFVCHSLNPQGYPAKDRSGALDPIEEPHLGRLMAKLRSAPSKVELTYAMPAAPAAKEAA